MTVTKADFNKIWASTSSVPTYTFTDTDYQNGWEFVGNLPPTRAMWDEIQRKNDEKMQMLYTNASFWVDSVADLRTEDAEVGTVYATKGYYAPNDGGNGFYNIRAKVPYVSQTVTTTAYTTTVPTGTWKNAKIKKLGGKTVVWTQYVYNGNFADGTDGWEKVSSTYPIIISTSDNELSVTLTSSPSYYYNLGVRNTSAHSYPFVQGHKYYISLEAYSPYNVGISATNSTVLGYSGVVLISSTGINTWTRGANIFTSNATGNYSPYFAPNVNWQSFQTDDVYKLRNIMLVDLTLLYGAGNEPTTVADFEAVFPSAYYDYSSSSLLSFGVTSVTSKNSSNTVLQTSNVSSEILALTGYGWSCPTAYNYVDVDNKKFVQVVGSRSYTAGDETDSSVITDGTNTYYELNSAVETDISAYLINSNMMVGSGGTLTFANQRNDIIPLPSEMVYEYGDVDDGGSVIVLDNGNVAELITDGTVNVKQFGARGDNSTDDTLAIQNAINTQNVVYIPITGASETYYVTTKPIHMSRKPLVIEGRIRYTGNNYALIFAPTETVDGLTLHLGTIYTTTGGCLLLDTTDASMQYLNIYFRRFSASTTGDCVHAKTVAGHWANEFHFINGRFARGLNGTYLDRTTATTGTSSWIFTRCGFEGIKNGVNVPEECAGWIFDNCRAYESLTTVVYSRATSFNTRQKMTWMGARVSGAYFVDCDNYEILMVSGYSQKNGLIIAYHPVVLLNKMIYGIDYNQGRSHSISSYENASTYDSVTQKQTVDFDVVYSYLQSTADTPKIELPITRTFSIPASSYDDGATSVDILMPESMFVVSYYEITNSYILNMEIKPGVTFTVYGKEDSRNIYSKTNSTASNIIVNVKISHVNRIYIAEELTGKIVTY